VGYINWAVFKRLNDLSSDNDIISNCQFSPNQKYIGAGTEDGKMVYWQYPETGNASNFQGDNKAIKNISFNPRSTYLTGISKDGKIITQRVKINTNSITAIGKDANSICFSPDGDFLVVGTANGTTELWDFASKTKVYEWATHTNVGNFLTPLCIFLLVHLLMFLLVQIKIQVVIFQVA
jgi:WD40 repeat protein